MQNTAGAPKKQTPVTFYLRTLLYVFIALLMRAITFAPLVALAVFPAESPLRYLSLLCPVLFIFFLLPFRFSFADALVQPPHGRYFSLDTALSTRRYFEKLGRGLLHALSVLKWGIPLAGMLFYIYYTSFQSGVDALTLIGSVSKLGASVTNVWNGIANFFLRLFGSLQEMTPASGGDMTAGLYTIAGILGLGLLILLLGAVRNSATRYIWAMVAHGEGNLRTETRRRLHGRRFRQLLVALLNLALWTPFLVVVFTTLKVTLADTFTTLMMSAAAGKLDLPDMTSAVAPLLFAFFVLYLPLLPVRRYLTAFFAAKGLRHAAAPKPAVQPQYPATPAAPVAAAQNAGLEGQNQAAAYPSPAYTPAPQEPAPVYETKPAYEEEPAPSYKPAPVYETKPVYEEEPAPSYEPAPVYETKPVYEEEPSPSYEAQPIPSYDPTPAQEPEPAYDPTPSFGAGAVVPDAAEADEPQGAAAEESGEASAAPRQDVDASTFTIGL